MTWAEFVARWESTVFRLLLAAAFLLLVAAPWQMILLLGVLYLHQKSLRMSRAQVIAHFAPNTNHSKPLHDAP